MNKPALFALTLALAACQMLLRNAEAQTYLHEDDNLQSLTKAARSLKFSVPGNKAFILEKYGVALTVVFGFADNRAGCEEMAEILNAKHYLANYKCHPIY
jgi:hypothetical protein